MKKLILKKTLQILDDKELRDFKKFLASPFFNTNKSVIKVFEYLRKFHPDYPDDKVERRTVFRNVFGSISYNDTFMRVTFSRLQTLLEEFLILKNFDRNKIGKIISLLDETVNRSEALADDFFKERFRKLEETELDSPYDYLNLHRINFYELYLYSRRFYLSKKNKFPKVTIDVQKNLICFFLLKLLADHFYILNQAELINDKPELLFLDEAISFIENNPEFQNILILKLTYLRVKLLKENKDEVFMELKNLLYKSHASLQLFDVYNSMSIMLNYCAKKHLQTNNKFYTKQKFEILKFGLKNDVLSFSTYGKISTDRFVNIVHSAVELQEIDWAETFIMNYSKSMEGNDKNTINICRAELLYAKGDFERSLEILSGIVHPKETNLKVDIRILELKIYYDLNYTNIDNSLDAFRHFIKNDVVLAESKKIYYKNFITAFSKLIKAGSDTQRSDAEVYIKKTPMVEKNWLLEKLKVKKIL
ncbi:MAG: hypothetical protein N2510_00060 [Ignavibacteria bacterium]|nr:hypothetical protein [Ignavibacteria bacterium]